LSEYVIAGFVRRRGQFSVRLSSLPVRFSLMVVTATSDTLLVVNDLVAFDELRIARVARGLTSAPTATMTSRTIPVRRALVSPLLKPIFCSSSGEGARQIPPPATGPALA
jgi:hypothetical protein